MIDNNAVAFTLDVVLQSLLVVTEMHLTSLTLSVKWFLDMIIKPCKYLENVEGWVSLLHSFILGAFLINDPFILCKEWQWFDRRRTNLDKHGVACTELGYIFSYTRIVRLLLPVCRPLFISVHEVSC